MPWHPGPGGHGQREAHGRAGAIRADLSWQRRRGAGLRAHGLRGQTWHAGCDRGAAPDAASPAGG